MSEVVEKVIHTIRCSGCNQSKEMKSDRLPPKWRRQPTTNLPLCGKCWGSRYIVRAVTVPISGPDTTGNPEVMRAAWDALRPRLWTAWDQSTALANWAVQRLQMHDTQRTRSQTRIAQMAPFYLYGEFGDYPGRSDWDGATQSAQSLFRTVEACWKSERLETI